ncbi:MAG: hypothetical protein KJ049_05825 [Gammaproteobacteria bacterium]|nr:hypothetical protein [Gammaproteobacteria bacterium]
MPNTAALARLEKLRLVYSPVAARDKHRLIGSLANTRLPSAPAVRRLHEILCWMRAYPDDEQVLAAAEATLAAFAQRPDLRRFRTRLANSGIAGTAIHYHFFWPMARWLAARWPALLRLDRDCGEGEDWLRSAWTVALPWIHAEAAKRSADAPFDILDALRGTMTDAAFLVQGIDHSSGDALAGESLHDLIQPAYVFEAGQDSPSRTAAHWSGAAQSFFRAAPERGRTDLRRELQRAPVSVRPAASRDATELLDLARGAMLTRNRDLDAFTWGNPQDIHIVDDGAGLAFAFIGIVPERRLPLAAVYGFLMLRNGVPVGYGQVDALLGSAEIAFNTFDSFRGGESAFLFARLLAATRTLLGSNAFTLDPYQLGHENPEGIASGAWWFYYKLGFRPHDPALRRIVTGELARMQRKPRHRSSPVTLARLARKHLYWEPLRGSRAWLPLVPGLGLRLPVLTDEQAGEVAAYRLGMRSLAGWSPAEILGLYRLAPLVAALQGLESWTPAEKESAVAVLRAKGGQQERDFLRLLDAHPKLGASIRALLGARS